MVRPWAMPILQVRKPRRTLLTRIGLHAGRDTRQDSSAGHSRSTGRLHLHQGPKMVPCPPGSFSCSLPPVSLASHSGGWSRLVNSLAGHPCSWEPSSSRTLSTRRPCGRSRSTPASNPPAHVASSSRWRLPRRHLSPCAPGMGAVSRVKVPNGEGSGNRS
jgi:hypothetical protein